MNKVIYIRKSLSGGLLTISKDEFMTAMLGNIPTGLGMVLEE